MVVIRKKWLYSGKSGCIRTNWFCSVRSASIRAMFFFCAKWLYSGNVLVFGQSGFIRAKVVVFWVKVVVFEQKWLCSVKTGCNREKWLYLGQKWLYSGKSGFIRAKVVVYG